MIQPKLTSPPHSEPLRPFLSEINLGCDVGHVISTFWECQLRSPVFAGSVFNYVNALETMQFLNTESKVISLPQFDFKLD